jgi:DNA-binding XRE family transcriptional regulator
MNEDKFYEEVGQLIIKERLNAGVKQEDLANFLELSRASVVNIEKGRQRPSTFLLINIAKYLNIDFTKLIPSVNSKATADASFNVYKVDEIAQKWHLNTNSKNSLEDFLNLIKK